MRNVKLFGRMNRPLGRGPSNGMYALQKALQTRIDAGLGWLSIVGTPEECDRADVVWFWNFEDKIHLIRREARGQPWICGPNVLFELSWQPRQGYGESVICDACHCRMLFTESEWYAELIRQNLGPKNKAPIVIWPYPIDPMPEGPLPAEHDVLVYQKSGPPWLAAQIQERYPNSILVRYGQYQRQELWEAARRSRCCVYLSDDDRGPLALAEILLCGCPSIGIERGAPWVCERDAWGPNYLGVRLSDLDLKEIADKVDFLLTAEGRQPGSREICREQALMKFSPRQIAERVIAALQAAREDH